MADSILLIDADADGGRALGDYFERLGSVVTHAATGETGLDTFERVRPDVVILEFSLPDANGLVVLERLRASGGAVILLTGHDDGETAARAMQLGAEHCLRKPVDLNHLGAAAARVAEKTRLARENALLRARLAGLEHLPADLRKGGGAERRHSAQTLAAVERAHIEKTLKFHGGNRTRTARELGISRATLINKIREYGPER
jgi:DNA-binding NtrC family response regulator